MSKPVDYLGVELEVGQTVAYVGAGYTTFITDTITKISPKTVTVGEKTPWGSSIRRPFNSVLVLPTKEVTGE